MRSLKPVLLAALCSGSLVPAAYAGITPAAAERAPETEAVPAPEPDQAAVRLDEIKSETAQLQAERERIVAEMQLAQAKLEQKLAPKQLAMQELQARMDELKAQIEMAELQRKSADDAVMAELRKKSDRLLLEAAVAKNEVDIEGYEMRKDENLVRRKTSALALQMELQQKETEARTYATKAPAYLKEPLQGKKLVLSDRCIALNGIVTAKTADGIVERINYFNNRDTEAPIFIVIDDCPGGSVMAGYKILKAMHGSSAPVYTVVKSFAASLAACITTLAEKSFAYPNAIILHHQLSSVGMGNLTQQRETVRDLEEWWRRLADPIAQKMGISREEFITQMYKKSSTGDWNEFADDAQKLKWVDVIVEEIEETALLRHPDSTAAAAAPMPVRAEGVMSSAPSDDVVQAKDDRGRPVALLPRLNPLDAYWMYNPDGFYRMQ